MQRSPRASAPRRSRSSPPPSAAQERLEIGGARQVARHGLEAGQVAQARQQPVLAADRRVRVDDRAVLAALHPLAQLVGRRPAPSPAGRESTAPRRRGAAAARSHAAASAGRLSVPPAKSIARSRAASLVRVATGTTPPSRSPTSSPAISIATGTPAGSARSAAASTGPAGLHRRAAVDDDDQARRRSRRDRAAASGGRSRPATRRPCRPARGVHAVVMRRRALDGHRRERRRAGRLGELAAHVLTARDALAHQRRRGRRERVLARDPDGVRDAGGDVEVPLREVGQPQRAGGAPRRAAAAP